MVPGLSFSSSPFAIRASTAAVDREESEIEDEVASDYDIYPVVSIGVTYRF